MPQSRTLQPHKAAAQQSAMHLPASLAIRVGLPTEGNGSCERKLLTTGVYQLMNVPAALEWMVMTSLYASDTVPS